MSDHNPFEADLDIDEETGEVELPPGYRGRTRRTMGQPPTTQRQVRTPTFNPTAKEPVRTAPAPNPDNPPPNGSGASGGRSGDALPCPPCPPCPSCPGDSGGGRLVSPGGFPVGLIVGLGLVGSALWWSGKMLSDIEEVEDELDSLPGSVPRMLAASNVSEPEEDIVEGELVEDAGE